MSLRAWSLVAVLCLGGWAGWSGWVTAGDEPVKYRLAYRFAAEQVVAYEIQQESTIHHSLNEINEVVHNKSEFRRHYRVVAAESDGTGELETSIDRVHMTAYSEDGNGKKVKEIVFKSDDPAFHDPNFRSILASVGKPQAIVKVNAAGKTLKVTPTRDANLNATENNTKDPTKSPESYLAPLPEEAVAIGDFWKEKFEVYVLDDKLPVKIDMLRTYKLTSVENGLATVEFKTAVLTNVDEPSIQIQLMQRETSGKILFDLAQGLVVGREVTVERTVLGPFQGKGSMKAVSTYKERRVTDETLANKPATTETK